jgi:iron uptake system EfeUOB component EfeO/EfeM
VDKGRLRWIAASLGAAILVLAGTAVYLAFATNDVTVDQANCGSGWAGPAVGRQTITLRNTSPDTAQVYVIDPAQNLVYAEARDISPDSTRDLDTTLGSGRYALRCVFSNGPVLTSKAYQLTGTVAGAVAGVPPMPDLDLDQPVVAYRAYVKAALPALAATTRQLAADVTAGDLARARIDWLPAHLAYERLGAAYNSFGDFDGAINGTTEGLVGGVHDPSWTGFFRIEYDLWHGQTAATIKPLTDQLRTDVAGLIADFPSEDIDPADLPLRSHEILENALEFQVSGANDYGSGTSLATTYANTQGTGGVLATIAPLIAARQPALLTAIEAGIATVQADLLGCRHADTWIAADQLPPTLRQKLDADLGALLEQLAVVPNLLFERTSA